ncbi:MAG: histidine kinase dimerization/phospho-acceptor domain-containing protein, partial [Acholeplasmataceae bacterium]
MRRFPIFYRFLTYFILSAIILIAFVYAMQTTFLPSFYHDRRIERMTDEIEELDRLVGDEEIDRFARNTIEQFQTTITSRVTVYAPSGSVLYNEESSALTPDILHAIDQGLYDRIVYDGRMPYLHLYAQRENYIYRLEVPHQDLEEALRIMNDLYAYVVVFAVGLSLLLALAFSRQVARPLVRLSGIAKEMANLNFDVVWQDNRRDEIGELGQTLNHLTRELQLTIERLRTELAREKRLESLRKSFVSTVSHELQTPLAVILGTIEAIEDGMAKTDEERAKYFETIVTETRKISRLAHDMLDLSQLESGTFRIARKPFDYRQLLEETVAKFNRVKRETTKRAELTYTSRNTVIRGDASRIEQVLNNLLENAFEHAEPETTIAILVRDEDGLITRVTNIGPRIEADHLDDIFKSFYKSKSKGTG